MLGLIIPIAAYADFVFKANAKLNLSVDDTHDPVVHTALEIFSKDYVRVFGGEISFRKDAALIVGTLGHLSTAQLQLLGKWKDSLQAKSQAFFIGVSGQNLYVIGSDNLGTAYGILELSRMIGVSPWEWWADAEVQKKKAQVLKDGFIRFAAPSVKFRGIFINDEDWGLQPWAAKTYETETGDIGPKTYAKVFELLLRLRANLLWPAMHPSTKAFFHYPENIKTAAKYGVYIGSSHAEPMLRNNVDEWKEEAMGAFNYLTNQPEIYKYWSERVQQSSGINAIYTLGIRGVHDSKMLGANTLAEQEAILSQVIKDQRALLTQYINPAAEKIPQVFIPYKEVQDIYDYGLRLPEDVSLIWCDDNYGYIRHFPNEKEKLRKGGNGVYYHISYWGRPHDYLWLATTHPAQVYTQMKRAFDKGARHLWVVNVGDIKPAEYLTEMFLDLAWDINSIANSRSGLDYHLKSWLGREFGAANAPALLEVMNEYYRLAYIRKPEFMGSTRTEEKDPKYKSIADLPWSEQEIRQRLSAYKAIDDKVRQLEKDIPPEKRDAWFQLIAYPVRGAAAINRKLLFAQLARHGKAGWPPSDAAFDTIKALTAQYDCLRNGKWKGIMNDQPRGLAVFERVPHDAVSAGLKQESRPVRLFNGIEFTAYSGAKPVGHGLGYQRGAISVKKGSAVDYTFVSGNRKSAKIQVALAPNHPVEGSAIRYAIQVDGQPVQEVDYATQGRSEEWKENVLRNQALCITSHQLSRREKHTIKIKALDEGVVIDQITVW
ncbi:glycosyl hydrolase 115 family protein [Niabella insulamsoli]|uniref:glycosyl hydrolase 115 family protein n=1 Tax=Niabella insulamsoli TaxID=3144874 RepID=UPI0031FD99D4